MSDAHRRLHQYKEALIVMADSLLVAPEHLNDAIDMWVKFKVESCKWIDNKKDILDWLVPKNDLVFLNFNVNDTVTVGLLNQ